MKDARHEPAASARKRLLLITGVSALALVVTACGGSALDPEDVAEANAAARGETSVLPSDTGAIGSTDPGSVLSDDTGGSSGSTGGSSGSTGGSSGSTGGASGSTGGSGSGSGGSGGGGTATATGGAKASCVGFKNQVGITDKTITIANIADVSGPVPGIFLPAQQAVKAYAEYFNATSDICGRKLAVASYDSKTNAGGDQVAYVDACEKAFAAVGSMAGFDSGGAATAEKCGIPDLRALAVSSARGACDNCFGAQATGGGYQSAIPDFFLKNYKAATQKAAMLYVNESESVINAKKQQAASDKRGWNFVYSSPYDVAEFNYGPYVQQLKSKGARLVQFLGAPDMALRMRRAMESAGYKPDFFLVDATQYADSFIAGGKTVDDTVVTLNFVPFEEVSKNPEMQLYFKWLQQVSPGAKPTYFGVFAWSAARLFVEQAAALGGKLTRASLIQKVKGVHKWDANGLTSEQDIGGKTSSKCWRFVIADGGKWKPFGGTSWKCGPLIP